MKTLSPDEIESLLDVRPSKLHPLEILGYGYNSEGAHRFRIEHPDFFSQIIAYIQEFLEKDGVFPAGTDIANPGYKIFIFMEGSFFRVSSIEETSISKTQRICSEPLSKHEAIRKYVQRSVNADYIYGH